MWPEVTAMAQEDMDDDKHAGYLFEAKIQAPGP